MRSKAFLVLALLILGTVGFGTAQEWGQPPDEGSRYTPLYLGFVPGISIPFGAWDVSLAASAIGGAVHDVRGIMGAGVFNLSHDVRGLQVAGVWNRSADLRGLQSAGVFNIASEVHGAQGAGVFNIAGDLNGFQSAGVFNIANRVHGIQGAGVFNIATSVDGIQASGVFNVAERVKGLQFGLVNVAGSLDGIQIGLVNIAKDGVSGLGAYYEPQTDFGWAYWQNGGRTVYTVVGFGLPVDDLGNRVDNLMVSAGLGTRLGVRSPYMPYLDVEFLLAQALGPQLLAIAQSQPGDSVELGFTSPWPELKLRLGLPVARGLALVGGLTVDLDAGSAKVPEALKAGWSVQGNAFGGAYTLYTRWFLGLKI